jgi:intron-binding protein aquarius
MIYFFLFQLMARPLKLHIIPQETFPTQRPNNCAPQGVAQEVGDMPQMAAFVYEFYIQKVQAMKSAFYVSTWYFLKMQYVVPRPNRNYGHIFMLFDILWKNF